MGYDHADAARLMDEVQQEYVVRYGTPDEAVIDLSEFRSPLGAFFVGYDELGSVVSGAWRRRTDVEVFGTRTTAEIKRMYVVPRARGRGHARAMLAHIEATAQAAGAEAMILETGARQPEGIALYLSAGYTPIPDFGHYAGDPLVRSFGRRL